MYMPRDGKVNEMPNPKTAEEIFAERIAELEAELAALKEKYRWRKQSEEPHQTLHEGEYIEAIVRLNTYVLSQRPFVLKCWKDGYTFPSEEVGADSILYWRPLDLPEMGETK